MPEFICVILDDEPLAVKAISFMLVQLGVTQIVCYQKATDAVAYIKEQSKQNSANENLVVFADYTLNNTDITGADVLSILPAGMLKCLVSAEPMIETVAKLKGWPFLQKPIRREVLASLLLQLENKSRECS